MIGLVRGIYTLRGGKIGTVAEGVASLFDTVTPAQRAELLRCGLYLPSLYLPDDAYGMDRRLLSCVQAGTVAVGAVALPSPSAKISPSAFTGGADHRTLCARAATWLVGSGHGWRADRLGFRGRAADVASTDGSVLVECGFTDESKVLMYLANARAVLLVPYMTRGIGFLLRDPSEG